MPGPAIPALFLAGGPRPLGFRTRQAPSSTITPLRTRVSLSLTSKDTQAKVEVQQTVCESREDEAERGEDAPNHHDGARSPAGAQGTAHWAWKGGGVKGRHAPWTPKLAPTLLIGCFPGLNFSPAL